MPCKPFRTPQAIRRCRLDATAPRTPLILRHATSTSSLLPSSTSNTGSLPARRRRRRTCTENDTSAAKAQWTRVWPWHAKVHLEAQEPGVAASPDQLLALHAWEVCCFALHQLTAYLHRRREVLHNFVHLPLGEVVRNTA